MIDPLNRLLQQAAGQSSPFGETSRYLGIEVLRTHLPDGREVTYLDRRFLPRVELLPGQFMHAMKPGDRLDNLAYDTWGNPEAFWRICDANFALRPADLTDDIPTTGEPRRIRLGTPVERRNTGDA